MVLVPQSYVSVKARFFLGIVGPMLLRFLSESGEEVTVYNPQRMSLTTNAQGAVTLICTLSTSSALVVEARFISQGVSQIPSSREKFFWPGVGPCWSQIAERRVVLV